MRGFGAPMGVLLVATCLVLVGGLAATTGQAGPTTCATTGCLHGIKHMLGLRNSEYERLTEDLMKRMKLYGLQDIYSTAWDLSRANLEFVRSPEYIRMAEAVGSLRIQMDEFGLFCHRFNLANVRLLAEAINRSANLGPEEIIKPIERVTTSLVNVIAEAWSQCPEFWERNSTFPLEYRLSSLEHERQVANLALVPKSYLYDNQVDSKFYEQLSAILQLNEKQASEPIDANAGASTKPDKSVLVKQIQKYIHEPCAELIKIESYNPLLRPFFDLLISNHLISPVSLAKFYENENTSPRQRLAPKYHEETKHWAELYEACARLTAMPSKKLAKAIVKARN